MHHFVTWAGLVRKSKSKSKSKGRRKSSLRRNVTSASQPRSECDEKKDVEATDPPACCHFDVGSGDVSQLNSTSRSNNEDVSTCKADAITGRPAFKSSIHSVDPDHDPHDPASPNARADPPNPSSDIVAEQRPGSLSRVKRSKSVFTTLSRSIRSRVRSPPPPYTPNKPLSTRTQNDLHRRMSYRPQAVPVVLSSDPASRERRDAALRARGLLPARPPRDLSAIEADADRRIDALGKIDNPFSGPDNGHSDANEIAQSWRIRNSMWLPDTLPNSDSLMTEDPSPLDASSQPEGSSEPPIAGADPSGSALLTCLPSISESLSLGPPTHSHEVASSRGSIGHQDSRSSRAASLISTGLEGWMLPTFNLEDLATETPTSGISEDMTAVGLPTPSKASPAADSQAAETLEASVPSQRSVSPSLRLECSHEPSLSKPQSSEPHNVAAQAQLTIPASSPLYLLSSASDTFLPSPTTPTLSQSVCYSSSETEDADNEEFIYSPISPAVMNDEGGLLCQETIVERSEPLSDDDDIDTFHNPPSPSLLTVIPRPTGDGRGADPRRTPGALLNRLKSRASTLGPTPPSALSKSTSMVSLRRTMSGSLFSRTRARSTVASATPPPPRSPLMVKMYDRVGLSAETSEIVDDEARRLSELAFLT